MTRAAALVLFSLGAWTPALAQDSTFDIWYGDPQPFGQLGNPQVWVNVLGNVSDPDGVSELTFSLNGGPDSFLSLGPNSRRLLEAGDFNVEIPFGDLLDGPNTIQLEATDGLGNVTVETVTVDYTAGQAWPQDFTTDWAATTNLVDEVQVTDGQWAIDPGGIRPTVLGYDRAFAIGDLAWTDYELTVPITVNAIDPAGYDFPSVAPAIGFITRWPGHSELQPGEQPHQYWIPSGGTAWYDFGQARAKMIVFGGPADSDPLNRQLVLGTTYIWKVRVDTQGGDNFYGFKFWEEGDPEPVDWQMSIENPGGQGFGSVLFIAHHVDAVFGDIAITSLGADVVPPQISNVGVTPLDVSATVTWDTNEAATSVVDYGLTNAFGSTASVPGLVTGHSVGLTNLLPATLYYYEVTSADAAGNVSSSGEMTFMTQAEPGDTGLVSDDFSSVVLDTSIWALNDPLGDSLLRMTGTEVEIQVNPTVAHDPWTSGILTPRISQASFDENLSVEVRFDSILDQNIQQQGLLFEQSPTRFVRMEFLHHASQLKALAAYVDGGSSTLHHFAPLALGVPAYMRVLRSGDDWTLLHSDDGVTFSVVTAFQQPIVVSNVSVYAGNSAGTPHTMTADYFFNSVSPIANEDENPSALVVNTIGPGTVQRTPDLTHYSINDLVDLLAVPDPGNEFLGWTGDAGGDQNPLPLVLLNPTSVTATFVPVTNDCNGNGVNDTDDITNGTSLDCDGNGVPDECDLDCDGDGVPDACEADCDGDNIPDDCETDCNGNGVADVCEGLPDCDSNGIPDECEVFTDCNGNGTLDACDIASGTSSDVDGNGVPDECEQLPLGQWRLDEGVGSIAADSSTNGNDGTIVGPLWSMDTPNGSPYSLDFDGEDDRVDLGPIDITGSDLTMAAWIRPDDFDVQDARILSKASGVNTQDHFWMLSTIRQSGVQRLRFRLRADGSTDTLIATAGDLPTGAWVHVAGVYDGTEMRVYVDGVPVGSRPKSGLLDVDPGLGVTIGNQPPGAGPRPFDGLVDDVRLYDRALSDLEIMTLASGSFSDCNGNGVADVVDIASGTSEDCTGNGIPDECDIAAGTSPDGNGNGIPDECELDCNGNGVPDSTDIGAGTSQDCNANGVPDECDITAGTSQDCDGDGVPDECQTDCDGNGVPDGCDIASGTHPDCNGNGVPDLCDIASGTSEDCTGNGIPDECDIASGTSSDGNGNGIPDECEVDCNGNGVDDSLDIAAGTSQDCNGNGVPDECDITAGTSQDCSGDGIPDECQADCDGNGIHDVCDISSGTHPDCNGNGVPDLCDIASGTSQDCNGNGTPDDCEADCDSDGIPDDCEIDCDASGVPDDCEVFSDCNSNGVPDTCEPDCDNDGTPDECELTGGASDCNGNGIPDVCDIADGTSVDVDGDGVPDECGGFAGHWLFDEGVGNIAGDSSPGGNDGNIVGALWSMTTNDSSPYSLDFDGVDDAVNLGALDVSGNELSIAFWMRPDDFDVKDARLFSKAYGVRAQEHYWMVSTIRTGGVDRLRFRLRTDGFTDTLIASSGDLNPGEWVHVAAVYDGSAMTLFLDGIPVGSRAKSGVLDEDPGVAVSIANQPPGAQNKPFDGLMDDVRLYARGLSAGEVQQLAGSFVDCNGNGVPDSTDIANGTSADCNANGIPDSCDIASGAALDCNTNGIPDECDVAAGTSEDCNANGVPDDCDIAAGTSDDLDGSGVPDECEVDCNGNGVEDGEDISSGTSADCNSNGVPDECDIASGTSADVDGDGVPDECGNLVGHWLFDEGAGPIAADSSPSGNDGDIVGAIWSPTSNDGSPFSLDFDGVDDAVNVGSFDVSGSELTLAAWIRPDDFGIHDARILSKAFGTRAAEHLWMLSTITTSGQRRVRLRLATDGSTSTLVATGGSLTDGVWAHVAAVYDGSAMMIYVDGLLVGSLPKSGDLDVDSNVGVTIGNQPPGAGNRAFDGKIDDVRVYARALSPAEIQQLAGN